MGLGSIGNGGMSSQQGAGQTNACLQQQPVSVGGLEPHTPSPQVSTGLLGCEACVGGAFCVARMHACLVRPDESLFLIHAS